MMALASYTILFAVTSSLSVVLTGDRALLSGNLLSVEGILRLLFNWRFVAAMALALVSRMLFVLINSKAAAIPSLSDSATTVTTLITAFAYPVIVLANYWFLDERVSPRQIVGASLIVAGIWLSSATGSTSP